MQTQASSAKFVDTSMLTSTTAEAKTIPLEPLLPPLLNVVSMVDVSSLSALIVCSDVIKDVTTYVTMNVVTDHANVSNDIVTLVEEIVHEDENKAEKSDVIANMAEDAVDETVGQSYVENDDGHAAGEKIVAIRDENVK